MLKITSYLSGWIANLGVVPLFWFWAFLLLPIFTFLFALRLRVTLVLETIIFSLTYNQIRLKNLTKIANYVKISILISLLYSTQTRANKDENKIIFLGKGQVFEIKGKKIRSYTIGNKEVIKSKLIKNNALLVKANKIGYSDIFIWWADKNSPEKYTFNIMSKNSILKKKELESFFSKLNIKVKNNLNSYELSGELHDISHYKDFVKVIKQNDHFIRIKGLKLSPSLRKEILIEIYEHAFKSENDQLNCNFKNIKIVCYFDKTQSLQKESKIFLENSYFITFIPLQIHKNRTFKMKMHIIQIENTSGNDLNLGLDKVSGQLSEFFDDKWTSILKKNSLLINNHEYKVSTLAKPESVIRFNHPTEMKIGSEIPYNAINSDQVVNTQWKFAGLKVKVVIKPQGELILLNFDTRLTSPTEGQSISGNYEQSSSLIKLGHSLKLFDIFFQTSGNKESKLPYLSSIPILGKIFSSTSGHAVHKKILGFLVIEEVLL